MNAITLPNGVIMGHRSYGTPSRRGNANNIIVGKYCSLAEGIIMDSGFNHRTDFISTYPFHIFGAQYLTNVEQPEDIIIENDVWIGESVLIMGGVKICSGAVVGAKSLVTKNKTIGPYEIWAGVPAKFIRKRFTDEQIEKLLKLQWWNFPDEDVLRISALLSGNNIDEFFKLYDL